MRIIDADVAQKIADQELSNAEAGAVQFVLTHTPTINAIPMTHGRWRYRTKGRNGVEIFCTACDSAPEFPQRKTKCCPNCGAKMDGENT